jgi:hypothetical protein
MTLEDLNEDDQIGDEQLTEKDKIINISNKKVAVKCHDEKNIITNKS